MWYHIASHDTHITNTRESALDFLTAETTRLPRRLETRGQEGFSISKSGEIETSAWVQHCWDESLETLEKSHVRDPTWLSFPILKIWKLKPQPYAWLSGCNATADPVRCHFLNLMLADAEILSGSSHYSKSE